MRKKYIFFIVIFFLVLFAKNSLVLAQGCGSISLWTGACGQRYDPVTGSPFCDLFTNNNSYQCDNSCSVIVTEDSCGTDGLCNTGPRSYTCGVPAPTTTPPPAPTSTPIPGGCGNCACDPPPDSSYNACVPNTGCGSGRACCQPSCGGGGGGGGGGFDCTQCGNQVAASPASTSGDPLVYGTNAYTVANCYRQDNGGAACCSCLDNGQCVGYWFCVNGTTYDVRCTQTAPGQICGTQCSLTATPSSVSIQTGQIKRIGASVSVTQGTIDDVRFASRQNTIAAAIPAKDTTSPYISNVGGTGNGTTQVDVGAYSNNKLVCSDSISVTVCDPNIWGAWSSCTASCGSGNQVRINQCGSSQTQPCCIECGPTIGTWGNCALNPGPVATKTQTISYNCQANTTNTVDCTGTINVRAIVVDPPTSCNYKEDIIGTVTHAFTPGSASTPAPQIQTGSTPVPFSNIVGGSYTVNPSVPAGYVQVSACWSTSTGRSGSGLSATLSVPQDNETLIWDLGYLLGTPWVQTGGSNVYAAGGITSAIAALSSPRVFSLNGTGGYPGVVRYGTDYDFDADVASKGETLVSGTKWLAQETDTPKVNYYDYFRIKLGGPITPSTVQEMGSSQESMSKPPSRTTPYYVVGDMTTTGDWTILDGETVIFIVDGNLMLGGKVNLVGSGFAAFIVNGNIIVSSSVGGLYTSSTPVIEGIYIMSPTGAFQTGTSTIIGKERFVAKGMFMAGGFLLQRNLDSVGVNTTTSSELFLYNPRLLFSMPDSMKDVPITWEEVAP